MLVAETDGVFVGYAKLGPAISLASHEHVLELGGLAVDPDSGRGSTSRRLVEAAVSEARRRGARKVTLRVLGT